MKKALYICLPLIGAALAACEDSETAMPEGAADPSILTIIAPTLTSASGQGESEMPASAQIYEFVDGCFLRSHSINPSEESVTISTTSTTKVYCVAGAETGTLTASTTLDDFLGRTLTSPDGAQSAPMFYAGASQLAYGQAEGMELELKRGVARIDLVCHDERVKISEVIVADAPAASLIIAADAPLADAPTVSYSRPLGDDFEGELTQAFTIFESAKPVTVRVKGTFDGDLMNFATTITKVARGKVYTVTISGGSELKSEVETADWQTGDNVDAALSYGASAIRPDLSTIPDGVEVNAAENSVTIPALGTSDLSLAFLSKEPVELASLLGTTGDEITCTPIDPVATDSGYISRFAIKVKAQPKCAAGYDVTMMLKGGAHFHVDINVEASPYQIATVRIAGNDWMCFNATSNDPEEQIYLMDDMTVDKMYNEHFTDCVGNYFQYGKPNPFSPWTSNDPTQFADEARNIPWRANGKVPAPKGFHPASLAEWTALIPNNTTIPSSYMTPSGDSLKATVVTLPGTLETPSAAVNARNFKMRYVLFESITTGAKLYVPIAGLKANDTAEVPGMRGYNLDARTAYWMSDDRMCWLIDFKKLPDDEEGALLQQSRWNYDGFLPVRCVKD